MKLCFVYIHITYMQKERFVHVSCWCMCSGFSQTGGRRFCPTWRQISSIHTHMLSPFAQQGSRRTPPPLKKQQEVSNRHSYLPSRHPGQDRCSSSLSLVPYSSDPSSSSSFLSICLRPPPFLLTHQRCVTDAPLLISSTYVLWPDLGAL